MRGPLLLPLLIFGCARSAPVEAIGDPAGPVAQCGNVGALPLSTRLALLDGRLEMMVPEGAGLSPMTASIMSAPEPEALHSRVYLELGDEKYVVMVSELFQRAGEGFSESIAVAGSRLERLELLNGGSVTVQLPEVLDTSTEAVLVAQVTVQHPDSSLQTIHFYVNPQAATDAAACHAMVMASVRSLAVGPRALQVGGPVSLPTGPADETLNLILPDGWTTYQRTGPDFVVHHLQEIGTTADAGAFGLVYFGGHPSPMSDGSGQKVERSLFGAPQSFTRFGNGEAVAWEALVAVHGPLQLQLPAGELAVGVPRAGWFAHVMVGSLDGSQTRVEPMLDALGAASWGP